MAFWEKAEELLDVGVEAWADGYVASKTPAPTAQPQQPYPEQTVTQSPANASDRGAAGQSLLMQAQPYLPWALVALFGLWFLVRSSR